MRLPFLGSSLRKLARVARLRSSAEAEISTEESATSGFRVNLEVYSGPFDALLGMIANNRLELTEVSSPRSPRNS